VQAGASLGAGLKTPPSRRGGGETQPGPVPRWTDREETLFR